MSQTLESVTPFGILKTIRYMVNSTAEFMEVLYTVNHILGTVSDRPTLVQLLKEARFSVLPLPHSQSKFVACFDVPSELLGLPSPRKPMALDYAEYSTVESRPQLVKKPPVVLMQCPAGNLFDINLALYNFEASLASAIPPAQWMRVKRSIQVIFPPRASAANPNLMVLSAEANPALPIESQNEVKQPG